MSLFSSINGVKKELLAPGRGKAPSYEKNSKAVFHFRTLRLEPDGTLPDEEVVIDNTRVLGSGPFELLIGREFKLSILEQMVKEMLISEISRFSCPYPLVSEYPTVSKALREVARRKKHGNHDDDDHHNHTHQCGFSALVHGSGHKDLDNLMKDMPPLAFEIELLRVESPGSYQQDSWAMTDEEMLDIVPKLKETGNKLYKEQDYQTASSKYFEALGYLESLSIKEKPQSEEWNKIEQLKLPFLLNYSQCQLLLGEYVEVIRHTSKVLEFDPNNVKALYRRGRAHSATWNMKDAMLDLHKAVELDNSLKRNVDKELLELTKRLKIKNEEEKQRLKGKMFT